MSSWVRKLDENEILLVAFILLSVAVWFLSLCDPVAVVIFSDRCTMPLGMEDRRILSGSIRASSSHNYNHGPERARLNIVNAHGRTGAWVAKYRNNKQWLQIDCGQLTVVKGIATQGRREANQYVKTYVLSYSVKGARYRPYVSYGGVKVRKRENDMQREEEVVLTKCVARKNLGISVTIIKDGKEDAKKKKITWLRKTANTRWMFSQLLGECQEEFRLP